MKFSPAQNKAIYTHGDSLLVSAAAGSGKTAVLVERVIQKILNGGDISRLWIMTFTDAAAGEMRQKIERAVEKQLEIMPENEHLLRQTLLISTANISTIHSACKRILEQNFHVLGLDPGIMIGEESTLDILFDRLLEDFVEELYERAAREADLKAMIAFFSGGRNDQKLLDVLRLAYKEYEEQPFPKTVFENGGDVFSSFADDALYQSVYSKLSEALAQYEANLTDGEMKPLHQTKLWMAMAEEREALRQGMDLLCDRDFDAVGTAIGAIRFAAWNTRGKAYEGYDALLDIAKTRRTYAKELITSLQKDVFYQSAAQHMQEIDTTNKMLTVLFSLTEELDRRFTMAKRDKSMISFADLERLALELLVENNDLQRDTLVPTSIALSMRGQIDEIIVDEYQDTNRKQDLIFRALSKDGKNIFMVGDVKQSIYRFRAACPELFLEKKERAALAEENEITCPSYLYLNQNFRSHPTVLSFANQVFGAAMSARLGQIEYDQREQLNSGGLYPKESQGHVELDVILQEADDESDQTLLEKQADLVAEKIRALHGKPFYDVKLGKERPLEYGDMAVLCRVTSGAAGHFENALRHRGIGCINNNQDQQFLDGWEIKMLRAFLQVISNPYRDIPLVTLMYSDFYCFSAEDLARIRAEGKHLSFYDALQLRAQKDAACAAFLQDVEQLRSGAAGKRTDEVLQMIFARTHILDKIAAYPDGKMRVANMQLMLRYAAEYEKDSYKGLFSFLNYLDKMSAMGKILPGARSGEDPADCVQILSMHKSKGLEYPVCFLVNLEKGFIDRDHQTLISHNQLGFALKMREDRRFTEYTSLQYRVLHEINRREALSEEMRILYVALTRPKSHLYLVCAKERTQMKKLLTETADYCGSHPAEFLSSAPSALKWLLFALREQKDLMPLYSALEVGRVPLAENCNFAMEITGGVEHVIQATATGKQAQFDLKEACRLALLQYPFEAQTKLPIKISVSEVKGMRENDPDAMLLIPEYFGRKQPSFLTDHTTGNQVGNAVHKFMQFADFKTLSLPDGFVQEKKRLLNQHFLTPKELSLVEQGPVANFVAQPLFKDMVTADRLEKEKRFFFTVPAREIFENCQAEDPILLQGVLDCCYEKNGQFMIVDYKTDRLNSAAEFIERYSLQLELYRYGMHELTGKKADKLYLYSFHLNRVIEIS